MERIYYIGHALPDNNIHLASTLNIAVNNNEIGFLKSLNELEKMKIFTLIPMASFPKDRRILIKKGKLEFKEGFESTIIPFINIPIIKQISVIISLLILLIKNILFDKKNGFKEFKLININVHMFFSIPVYITAKIHKCKTICFLMDNVVEKRTSSFIKRQMYKIDGFLAKKIFTTYNGVITYSYKSATEYAPKVPCLEIYHIIKDELLPEEPINKEIGKNINISFTGSLTNFNGIKYIIDAFNFLPYNYILNICGGGELADYIIEKSREDKRIIYYGVVPNSKAITLQAKSDILLLIRAMDNEDEKYLAKYAVSGKLPEYLATGVPVVTNDVPAIPEGFRPYLVIIDSYDSQVIAEKIRELVEDEEIYKSYISVALKGRDYIIKNCNWRAQSSKIKEFINNI
ncbi:glycosyltransferase [Anaerosalibacter bizertensis]|uniref:Glycosyltransferase n=1 Tax=Anaerosalibacter bizertensis TaxID=932217 RepID=A0A9Q4ACZ5_9FIRM|nr:glycosyltransferase [Anaerosalibacter bizertensis]MBV1820475.1 glycosyltransferase [Bacteroidales bacterium MSK.15.36]MCB5559704.1 glycosyltransferase [Anaerosalibacter bizertensis]MCG4565609.1 glycosyltransferase [Anaerosalibacter bizertensis]MCG4582617.1 glycosyltransferase [Anaerosalibacter bizertensis]MCG4584812.1 glycosyltransferase [Anaerosalibacter bizertensis]